QPAPPGAVDDGEPGGNLASPGTTLRLGWSDPVSALPSGGVSVGWENTPLSGLCSRAGKAHPLRIFRKGKLAAGSATPSKNAEEEGIELDRAINLLTREISTVDVYSTPIQPPLYNPRSKKKGIFLGSQRNHGASFTLCRPGVALTRVQRRAGQALRTVRQSPRLVRQTFLSALVL